MYWGDALPALLAVYFLRALEAIALSVTFCLREGRISFVDSQGVDVNCGVRGNTAGNVLYQKNPVAFVEGSKPTARVVGALF
jgi:hypothetical protein